MGRAAPPFAVWSHAWNIEMGARTVSLKEDDTKVFMTLSWGMQTGPFAAYQADFVPKIVHLLPSLP